MISEHFDLNLKPVVGEIYFFDWRLALECFVTETFLLWRKFFRSSFNVGFACLNNAVTVITGGKIFWSSFPIRIAAQLVFPLVNSCCTFARTQRVNGRVTMSHFPLLSCLDLILAETVYCEINRELAIKVIAMRTGNSKSLLSFPLTFHPCRGRWKYTASKHDGTTKLIDFQVGKLFMKKLTRHFVTYWSKFSGCVAMGYSYFGDRMSTSALP